MEQPKIIKEKYQIRDKTDMFRRFFLILFLLLTASASAQVKVTGRVIDPAGIARKYNEYYQKMEHQCSHCKNRPSCIQCLFNLKDVDKKPVCYGFMNETMMEQFKQQQLQFMREHPGVYREIMEKVLTL